MQVHRFSGQDGRSIDLDLCFSCQCMWFDPQENTRLSPGAVLQLFELLHQHHHDERHPVAKNLSCPRCDRHLAHGFDIAKGGRYVTYRCAARHGRLSTFGSFMVEKGFVRHLSDREIDALAERVGTVNCSSCGGAVDIRKDHACPYCRSALALLDPNAVNEAIRRHAAAAIKPTGNPTELADALVALEKQRERELRERQRQRWTENQDNGLDTLDLLSAGVELVWRVLSR